MIDMLEGVIMIDLTVFCILCEHPLNLSTVTRQYNYNSNLCVYNCQFKQYQAQEKALFEWCLSWSDWFTHAIHIKLWGVRNSKAQPRSKYEFSSFTALISLMFIISTLMNAFECMQANTRICYHIMIVTKCYIIGVCIS